MTLVCAGKGKETLWVCTHLSVCPSVCTPCTGISFWVFLIQTACAERQPRNLFQQTPIVGLINLLYGLDDTLIYQLNSEWCFCVHISLPFSSETFPEVGCYSLPYALSHVRVQRVLSLWSSFQLRVRSTFMEGDTGVISWLYHEANWHFTELFTPVSAVSELETVGK